MVDLREKRETAGITRTQLAAALGVTERTVWRWEAGANSPRLDQAPALARALGIDLEDLFATHASERGASRSGRGNRTPRRRSNAPGHGSTEEPREQSAV